MKTTLPELITSTARSWQHDEANPHPSAPLADPKTRRIRDAIDTTEAAHAQRLTALVASRYNSRRPKQRAELAGVPLDLYHAAQQIQNRHLAHLTSAGRDLPRPRYYLPEQLAAHHAHSTPPTYAHEIAALAHHPQDRAAYVAALQRLNHNEQAEHAADLFDRLDSWNNDLTETLKNQPTRRHRLGDYRLTAAEYNAHHLARILTTAATGTNRARAADQKAQHGKPTNRKPRHQPGEPIWRKVKAAKPERPLNHTGRLGRRRIATNAGKNPTRIHNYCGDPLRRIFTRNSRGTRALVIVDSSGSMSLSTHQLNQILNTSHGATVVAYSHRHSQTPNTYLLAHNGRKVREIPDSLGSSNECDLTAAQYAVDNYARPGAPIIWITDGMVTGLNERRHPKLNEQCATYAAAHNIIISPDYTRAIADLTALRKGQRPPQRLETFDQ